MAKNNLMIEVSSLISFIKTQLVNDISTARNNKIIELSDEDVRKIVFVVNSSIDKSFSIGSNSLIKLADQWHYDRR